MKISFPNIQNIRSNFPYKNSFLLHTQPMQADCFVKTVNPSFKSNVPTEDNESDVIDVIPDSSDCSDNTPETKRQKKESCAATLLNDILEATATKKVKKILAGNSKYLEYFDGFMKIYDADDKDFRFHLYQFKPDINTGLQLLKLIDIYPQVEDVFKGCEYEFLKIYSYLDEDKKKDIVRWGDGLLSLYCRYSDDDKLAYQNINQFLDVMKFFNLQNMDKFGKKFAFLSKSFKNFETCDNKIDAYEYINSKLPEIKTFLAEKVFPEDSSSDDISSYVVNNTEEAFALSDYSGDADLKALYPYICHKFSPNQFYLVKSDFNNFSDYTHKLEFYNLLLNNNISPDKYKCLCSSFGFSEDIKVTDKVKNSPILISQLKTNKKLPDDFDVEDFYYNYSDLINHAYQYGGLNSVNNLTDFIRKFDLSSNQINSLYINTTGLRNKPIDEAKFMEFVDASLYLPDNQLDIVKRKKQIPSATYNELLKSKAVLDDIQLQILKYIQQDKSEFFVGQLPLKILNQYHDALITSDNIPETLSTIAKFNVNNDTNYSDKISKIKDFSPYFDDEESKINFIINSGISFDSDNESENEHRLSCLYILQSLNEVFSNDKDKFRLIVDKLSSSKFLIDSKGFLSDFFDKDIPRRSSDLIQIILDKDVPSIPKLYSDVGCYFSNKYQYFEYFEHLKNLPEGIKYSDDVEQLAKLQQLIREYGFHFKISTENLSEIDYNETNSVLINYEKDNNYFDINFVNKLFPIILHKNILSNFPDTYLKSSQKINRFTIASEIIDNMGKSRESYSNICRLMNIDQRKYRFKTISDKQDLASDIPPKLEKFILDDRNFSYNSDVTTFPNISLHARLRLIDRYCLKNAEKMDELYKSRTKYKLSKIIETIYSKRPTEITRNKDDGRYVVSTEHNGEEIKTVFSDKGTMITFMDVH